MDTSAIPPEIFDRRRRTAFSERAARRSGGEFLWRYIADELTERLALVSRPFEHALIVGPMAGYAAAITCDRPCALTFTAPTHAGIAGTVVADEDRLPFGQASFDLVIAGGTLDSVNDLPGALVQIRRILKPDGLFLGHMFGAGSLATLKSVMVAADGDAAAPHIHPQVDLRSAADLLARAGFALPVADGDTMAVRYTSWRPIVADVRDAGVGNALAGPRRYPGKDMLARLDAEWARRADPEGKLKEQFVHLFLSGWAPSPDQPKPARRGSGAVSLESVLSPSTKL